MKAHTLRFRMMVLFCSVVGVLLTGTYLAFWGLLVHELPEQFDRKLLETAGPVIADIIAEPNARDVSRMNIPGEYFELLDSSGHVLQRSMNLAEPIDLKDLSPSLAHPTFGVVTIGNSESVRLGLIPFRQVDQDRILAVAIPTLGSSRVIDIFGRIALLLFPLSLLLTAVISAVYVGRSLVPVKALTQHAALMAKRVTNRQEFWAPLPVSSPHDELGHLAETFNHLLQSVDSAVRQLRQFVTDAAHELRTPLAVLHGETELLLSKPRTPSEYRATLQILDDELKKLTRIVEGLFTLSMADAGQLRLACEPMYIDEVLEEACDLITLRARAKNISLVRNLKQEVEYYGDETILHELFLIFLDNAIKYSPNDTQVHVALEKKDDTIRVRFEDHGIGISSEHLPFIFQRFYRAAPSANGDTQSGGLGLAIAQAIVGALGGSIECQSTVGVGSTFTLVLPPQLPLETSAENKSKHKLILD